LGAGCWQGKGAPKKGINRKRWGKKSDGFAYPGLLKRRQINRGGGGEPEKKYWGRSPMTHKTPQHPRQKKERKGLRAGYIGGNVVRGRKT